METLTRSRIDTRATDRGEPRTRLWILAVILSVAAAIAVTVLIASSDEASLPNAPGADVLRRYHADSLAGASTGGAEGSSSTSVADPSSKGAPDSSSTGSDSTEALRRFHIDAAGG